MTTRQAILRLLRTRKQPVPARTLAERLGRSYKTVRNVLGLMQNSGQVRKDDDFLYLVRPNSDFPRWVHGYTLAS